jgi:hypothetical protein
MPEITDLREAEIQGKEHPHAQQQKRKVRGTAEIAIEKLDEGFKRLHRLSGFLLSAA